MIIVTLFLLLVSSVTLVIGSENKQAPRFIKALSLLELKEDHNYTFGYLEVPENRSEFETNRIRLPIYIFKSRSKNPEPDPIIYLVGGPGSSIMNAAHYMKYFEYLDDRDFILFEQRGTRYAEPHLDCPEISEALFKGNFPSVSDEIADSIYKQAVKDCRKRLVEHQ